MLAIQWRSHLAIATATASVAVLAAVQPIFVLFQEFGLEWLVPRDVGRLNQTSAASRNICLIDFDFESMKLGLSTG